MLSDKEIYIKEPGIIYFKWINRVKNRWAKDPCHCLITHLLRGSYPLRYSNSSAIYNSSTFYKNVKTARPMGVEPTTSRLADAHSSPLSYGRVVYNATGVQG